MGAIILVVCFLSGYVYIKTSKHQQHLTSREDGHRYYFRCGYRGFLFCLFAVLTAFILDYFNLPSAFLKHTNWTTIERLIGPTWKLKPGEYRNIKYFLISFLAVPYAVIWANICNLFRNAERSDQIVLERIGTSLEKYLSELGNSYKTVLITLNSRKTYVGIVKNTALEAGEVQYIKLLPILSGYRDEKTLNPQFTTNYFEHYSNNLNDQGDPNDNNGAKLEDFVVLLPVAEVNQIGQFNIDTYRQFIGQDPLSEGTQQVIGTGYSTSINV
ncbi:hypothetical protein [uncultured Shewanella sp.]|uniref:hypothetical protein n=1 Tax=uncultured Shewanella sp. TaxID=173975 RepID=UPI00263690CA|nr:hypothetical protein [uncultured Shewanella sp.]